MLEEKAIQMVVNAGQQHGFGNMITRLRYAWVLKLKASGCSWRSAALGALCSREQVRFIETAAEKDEAAFVDFMKSYTGRVV